MKQSLLSDVKAGSGTRGAFEELLGIEDQCQYD